MPKFKLKSDTDYKLISYTHNSTLLLDLEYAYGLYLQLINHPNRDLEAIKPIFRDLYSHYTPLVDFCEKNYAKDHRLEILYYLITGIGHP